VELLLIYARRTGPLTFNPLRNRNINCIFCDKSKFIM
jgi:hypothetical protein